MDEDVIFLPGAGSSCHAFEPRSSRGAGLLAWSAAVDYMNKAMPVELVVQFATQVIELFDQLRPKFRLPRVAGRGLSPAQAAI